MSAILQNNGMSPQIESSFVPKPARFLTDLQIKKIAIITLVALWFVSVGVGIPLAFAASPVVSTLGASLATFSGFVFGPPLIFLGGPGNFNNRKDYQSEKVAQEIHKDLQEKNLRDIVACYSLTELVRYGYIEQSQADRMVKLYNQVFSCKMSYNDRGTRYDITVFRDNPAVDQKVNEEFEILRGELAFIKN